LYAIDSAVDDVLSSFRLIVRLLVALPFAWLLMSDVCLAQFPAGAITGFVRDSSGAAVAGAQVQALSRATARTRRIVTTGQGDYNFPALAVGEYEIAVQAPGFRRIARAAIVEAGTTTRADFVLQIGDLRASISVAAASPQMHYDSAAVSGIVTRDQIVATPLNGRTFLELAKLEPGVQPPAAANRNRTVVPLLSTPATNVGGARFTVDGGSVTALGLGGSQMAFSQEAVQEFQVSSVNFDLAAGVTDAGSFNVITRAGGDERQGTAFYFFRDHRLSAYPSLTRDPDNARPFFQRQQFGFAAGGPVRRDRLFYFVNWERNDQRSVAATTVLAPEFAHFSRVTANPLLGDLFTLRIDAKLSGANTLFVRYSHDGSSAFGPGAAMSGGSANAYPSNWSHTRTAADQSLSALTSVISPTLVNDLRVSYFAVRSNSGGADDQDCPGCVGVGAPSINIPLAGLVLGNSAAIDNLERRIHLADSITWLKGAHQTRVGVSWEGNRDRNLIWANEPLSITLFSPDRVRTFNTRVGADQVIPLPATFTTLDDILQLPVRSLIVGIGTPGVRQENGGPTRRWNTLWLYSEDAWRPRESLTVTYGLGWAADGILNHDLRKPELLAPILGADGLGPTRMNWTNFSPVAGIVWAPFSDHKMTLHAGAGRFYGTQGLTSSMDAERVALGPAGLGRQNMPGSAILNPVGGVPGVPAGTPLDFTSPTFFTGADLLTILPAIRAALSQTQSNAARTVQQIQISKQASPAIFPVGVPDRSAVHVNVGAQRELSDGLVLSMDLVYRHFVHVPLNGGSLDLNHFDSVRGPVIPRCSALIPGQADDPAAQCSRGPINVQVAPYRFTYRGLLLRAEKRLSNGFQLLGSYAFSRSSGTNAGAGFSLDNWLQNTGLASNDVTHLVNVGGALRLPTRLELGFNFSYSSAPPFSVFLGGIDFNGDGTTGDLLPGTTVNAFNRGMGRADLERLVAAFNETYAGTTDSKGTFLPRLTLPAHYSFDDNFHSLDVRLTRSMVVRRHARLSVIGEVFNAYNGSNLTGYSGDVTSAAFGQPTGRVTQIFGSGGPRSFQLAARVSF
jgi:Carboxypeptidase regulatory-like domain